ncbi:MAG: fumarylacetoacetase [Planctomycetota bacterium]
MAYEIDATHDPALESWIESAQDPESDFPIQNLPIAACRLPVEDDDDEDTWLEDLVVPIGDKLLNISEAVRSGVLGGGGKYEEDFDSYIAYGAPLNAIGDPDVTPGFRAELRRRISRLLAKDTKDLRDDKKLKKKLLLEREGADVIPAFQTQDFTDFYASIHHATNVGSMFRPDNPLLPNYRWIPVGYHGRASSVIRSGEPVRRPLGQTEPAEEGGAPGFGPSKRLDYELEMGFVIGRGNERGIPIAIADAEEHVFGLCLLNDWSARDIQKWEYQPLGPFLSKSFASTISPYVVTMEALAPFRAPAPERSGDDPRPLPHLDSGPNREGGAIDVTLEVYLSSKEMRQKKLEPVRLSRGNLKKMYWTVAQMVAHHSSGGCDLQPGDLLGSGTVSGPTRDSRGCLLELTWDGDPFASPPVAAPGTARTPIELPTGERRVFLEDGDEVILRGFCEREGRRRIGFGSCRAVVQAAPKI